MSERSDAKLSRVAENFYGNFVNIVIAIVSIVQGLAFNDLAQKAVTIYNDFQIGKPGQPPRGWDPVVAAHFVLCFVLLLRIFQTYVTAALDYEKWEIRFRDLFIIFVVGLLEYFVFSVLVPVDFDPTIFHRRFLLLIGLAFIGYGFALMKVHSGRFQPSGVADQYYEAEMRGQLVNLAGVVIIMAISGYILISPPLSPATYTALASLSSLVLLINIANSINATFHRPHIEIETVAVPVAPEPGARAGDPAKIMIRQAGAKDIEVLADLAMDNFGYVYETLFDTSKRLTRRIISSLLRALGGRHEWGYRRFMVAVDEETGEVAGLLKTGSLKTGIGFSRIVTILIAALVLIRYTGLVGLLRTIRNSKAVRAATYPVFRSDEVQVHYLAVDPAFRRRSVGSQLLDTALKIAGDERKDLIALEVRETNASARKFFKKYGFVETDRIESVHDELFKKGRRIRMTKSIDSTNE